MSNKAIVLLGLTAPILFFALPASATAYTFYYNEPGQLKITVNADTYALAYPKASKLCFQALTGGKYPGEERGLDIIDVCINPLRHTTKEL